MDLRFFNQVIPGLTGQPAPASATAPNAAPVRSGADAQAAHLQGLRAASGQTKAASGEFESGIEAMPAGLRERNAQYALDALLTQSEQVAGRLVQSAHPLRKLEPGQVEGLALEIASCLDSAQRQLLRLTDEIGRRELRHTPSPAMEQKLDFMRGLIWQRLNAFRQGVREQLASAPQDLDFAPFMQWADGFAAGPGKASGQPAVLTAAALVLELLHEAARRLEAGGTQRSPSP
ncbi:hypothetical protein GT347_19635 [Xylophilus rhododendri]|uniref:Uncharacterized protein n=1 Tax=Xylophilus rhododendri TaxID=2697032 RepID=A0A857J8F3_9BURK|nr:hypothetical protein [Xylophilus rhododendri]QHI99997.1 hypothetical protein GT347_19635 [Xylophilus rhododendri]